MNFKNGTYRARSTGAQDVTYGVSENGNLQIAVVFQITDENCEYFGQSIAWTGTFASDKSTEISIRALENCGWQGEDPTEQLEGIETNEVNLVIENETSDRGRTYSKVRWVNSIGGGKIKFKNPIEGQSLRSFGVDIKNTVRAMRIDRGGARPSTQTRQRSTQQNSDPDGPPLFGGDEDDLPF
jgi:hypothetical protein